MKRSLLLLLFLFSLLFLLTAKAQLVESKYLPGTWMHFDSSSNETMTYEFQDEENVKIFFDGNVHQSNYKAEQKDSILIVTFTSDKLKTRLIIVPDSLITFTIYLPNEYKLIQEARKSGALISLGSNPTGMKFTKQTLNYP